MATRVSSPVVVGRDAELRTIESALHRAAGGSSLPYGPFVEGLRNLALDLGAAETAAVAGPAADDLARLVPAFGSLEPAPSPSEWVQFRLFEEDCRSM